MKEIWNNSCLFWANRETLFYGCWSGWSWSDTCDVAEGGKPVRAQGNAPCQEDSPNFSDLPNGHISTVFLITQAARSQLCLEQPCRFAHNFFVLWDQLWSKPRRSFESHTHTRNPFSSDSQEFEFDGWTVFSLYFFITVNCNFWPV